MAHPGDIGVVVVGLGIAGKVRVRDLQAKSCQLTLKGFVSRRQLDLDDVPQMSLDEALNRADVNALMICTEPALHEDYTRQALEKGKHVLVEYPLACSSSAAQELFQLAEDKGLILYEENIALLTEAHKAAQDAAQASQLKQATYSLSGSYNGWLEKFDSSGLPFVSGVSGLQLMLSLFGDLLVKDGKLERTENGYTAQAWLETQRGSPITMTLARTNSKEARRTKQVIYEFEDGQVVDTSKVAQKTGKKGLFMQDMENFAGFVESGKIPAESKRLSLRSLEIAEQIHSFFK